MSLLPWQTEQWQTLWHSKKSDRLPHAVLFTGLQGLGKRQFAEAFSKSILCKNPLADGTSCTDCHPCHMVQAKSHPDMVFVEPEEEGKKISVDQIRTIVYSMSETSMQGGFRVIIIDPANAMNANAANALLKTLEEPTPNTLIILISDSTLRLPATILSRCQKIIFHKPLSAVAIPWLETQSIEGKFHISLLLKLAHGAPLRALSWVDKDLMTLRQELYQGWHALSFGKIDALTLASEWHDKEQLSIMDLILSWLVDLLRFKLTGDTEQLINSDYQSEIQKISVKIGNTELLSFLDHVQQTRSILIGAISLNKQLTLEDLFIRWIQYASG